MEKPMKRKQCLCVVRTGAMLALMVAPSFCVGQASAAAQTAPATPSLAYDVVSIKPGEDSGRIMMRMLPDGYGASGITLRFLIQNAYNTRRDLILGGPGWLDTAHFDIEARVSPADAEAFHNLDPRQRSQLLKPVLAERFHLKVHTETKEMTVYHLVPAKGGPKLTKSEVQAPPPSSGPTGAPGVGLGPGLPTRGQMMRIQPGKLTAGGITMGGLAGMLSDLTHTTVVDYTGITGNYDVELAFTPEDGPGKQDNGDATEAPPLFTAIQEQLGLKLEPTRGPVEVLVVDGAEKPSTN